MLEGGVAQVEKILLRVMRSKEGKDIRERSDYEDDKGYNDK